MSKKIKLTKKEESFYSGVLAALAVVADHDQRVLFDEIVATMDTEKLVARALLSDDLAWSGLAKYGYGKVTVSA